MIKCLPVDVWGHDVLIVFFKSTVADNHSVGHLHKRLDNIYIGNRRIWTLPGSIQKFPGNWGQCACLSLCLVFSDQTKTRHELLQYTQHKCCAHGQFKHIFLVLEASGPGACGFSLKQALSGWNSSSDNSYLSCEEKVFFSKQIWLWLCVGPQSKNDTENIVEMSIDMYTGLRVNM